LIVAALRRYGLPAPPDETGKILRGLADNGIFRLRACVVGTVAYQTYAGILGVKLPSPTLQTGDLDLAQSRAVSVAIAEDGQTSSLLDGLQAVDPSFRAIPHLRNPEIAANYLNSAGYRVEMLTDNRGPDSDRPAQLPALRTHAQPLRFLDYLLRDAMPAVVLSNGGVLINVPQPERYAVHKLIVSQRRTATAAKGPKDLHQSSALFDALAERRAADLAAAWSEAYERGPRWQVLLLSALAQLDPAGRDRLLYATRRTRATIPNLDIEFRDPRPRYDLSRDVLIFAGLTAGGEKDCAISRAALDDWFGAGGEAEAGALRAFRDNRDEIQAMARGIYLNDPVPADGAVLIKTSEVPALRKRLNARLRRKST
jgi:hypothetical protein